jgi:hypothetical protein
MKITNPENRTPHSIHMSNDNQPDHRDTSPTVLAEIPMVFGQIMSNHQFLLVKFSNF